MAAERLILALGADLVDIAAQVSRSDEAVASYIMHGSVDPDSVVDALGADEIGDVTTTDPRAPATGDHR